MSLGNLILNYTILILLIEINKNCLVFSNNLSIETFINGLYPLILWHSK